MRLLIVLAEPIDVDSVRRRVLHDATRVAEPHEMAVCYVLGGGNDGIAECLAAARHITSTLRLAVGERAEEIVVLVASEREGCRVDDCARDWGATVVRA